MARQLRLEHPGAIWHVTSRGNERKNIFRDDDDRLRFLKLLSEAVAVNGWILHAYVMVRNHFHLVIETPECTLSRGMHWLNTCYVQQFNRRHRRVGHLYQGRFKGILVEKETHLLRLLRYVVLNPVRAKMVEKPGDWRWSSYRATAGLDDVPAFLTPGWTLGHFGPTEVEARMEYRQFVDQGIDSTWSPWDELKAQIYLGTDEWVAKMQDLVDTKPRSREFPKVQRQPMRPAMDDVIDAVSSHFSTSRAQLKTRQGGPARRLVAHIAWREGSIKQQQIAAILGVGSYTTVSAMIQRCRSDLEKDAAYRAEVDRCRESMRRRPPPGTGMLPPPVNPRKSSRRSKQR